jgi:pimeloyl-ACP methyl ester carboxylesterase
MVAMYQKEFLTLAHNKSGKPPLVYKVALHHWGNKSQANKLFCLHGLTRNARDFDFVIPALTEKYHVIAIDIVGRGDSDWLDDKNSYNYDTYFDDILQIVDQMKLDKISLLGTSMGGIIGMGISVRRPGLIDKLLLNDIGTVIPKSALIRIAKYISIAPEFANFQEAKDAFKIMLANFGIQKEEHWDHIVKHSTKTNQNNKLTFTYDPGIAQIFQALNTSTIEDVNLREEWESVNFNKMMLIHGKKSDILLQHDIDFILKSKPNIEYKDLANVGHAPALVNANEIKIVYDFFCNS